MLPVFSRRALSGATILSTLAGAAWITAAGAAALPAATPRVVDAVDDAATMSLAADLPHALAGAQDGGALADSTALPHIRLGLQRSPEAQAALDTLTRDQMTPGTADYQRWLKPADLRGYGPAQADIDKIVAWLERRGMHVNSVAASGMSIDFGGTAADVARAFHTSLHGVTLGGESHVANVSAPAIPAALAPVVSGVTLANFFPKPQMHRAVPSFTTNTQFGTFYAVAPQDFATIYNINPLRKTTNFFGRTITGAGVTIAEVEQTLIKPSDWAKFRQVFGLGGYKGTLSLINPGNCGSPGFQPDEGEAALDAEWSSASAPDANIVEASCPTAAPLNFGVETALQNLVEGGTTATIFSISYGGNEAANGFTFEKGWTNLLQEGAAEGKSIFVSSGDNGSSADRNQIASNGLFVNGLADSAYNTSIGGTDFYDTALKQDATYWRAANRRFGNSALSYVPEIPWDNSCASSILWKYEGASSAFQLCNSNFTGVQNGVGGSGSQSVYYAKPEWQSLGVPGVPNDGVRDQPDVSLFAANGIWAHFYLFCMSDAKEGGSPCVYQNPNDLLGNAAGGTSFGSPAFAGIAALVAQGRNGAALGNFAPRLYQVAKAQFTSNFGLTQCNASLGNKISSACVFNNVTTGNIAEPCYKGTTDCATTKASTMGIGVLAAPGGSKGERAYPAQAGYSFATGLGSVNVTNLLYNY